MSRKPRLTNNPRSRAKRASWLRRWCNVLEDQLRHGFCEAWKYGPWRKRGGRKVVKHLTVQGQVVECNRKLLAARRELAALEGGTER